MQAWYHERYEQFVANCSVAKDILAGDDSLKVTFDSLCQFPVISFIDVSASFAMIRRPIVPKRRMSRRVAVSAEADDEPIIPVRRKGSRAVIFPGPARLGGGVVKKPTQDFDTIAKVLQGNILFRNLDQTQLQAVVESMQLLQFNTNEIVIRQGGACFDFSIKLM